MQTEQIHELQFPHKLSAYLRRGMDKYNQVQFKTTDQKDGRCALGVVMSELGWNGVSAANLWGDPSHAQTMRWVIDLSDRCGLTFIDIVACLEVKGL